MCKYWKLLGMILGIVAFLGFKQQDAEVIFLNKALMSNHYEIEVAKLAKQKSNNDEIKAYAEMLINDHEKIVDELQSLAKAKEVALVSDLDEEHQNKWNMLNAKDSIQFNQAFKDDAIAAHEQAISLFEQASSDSAIQDGALKSLIISKLPGLKAHLDKAKVLQVDMVDVTSPSIPPHTKGEIK